MAINDPLVINDLLPFPYTQEALSYVAIRVEQVQEKLGRQLLVENLSSYLSFARSEMSEGEFLAELTRRTGCGILFDVENLYVNARNLGVNAEAFIKAIPAEAVKEYHLAGFSVREGCLHTQRGGRHFLRRTERSRPQPSLVLGPAAGRVVAGESLAMVYGFLAGKAIAGIRLELPGEL